jgi:hypothetical protein
MANVKGSDGTLWIGDQTTPGGKRTIAAAIERHKTWAVVISGYRPDCCKNIL